MTIQSVLENYFAATPYDPAESVEQCAEGALAYLRANLHPRDAKAFYKEIAKVYIGSPAYLAEKKQSMAALRKQRLDKIRGA